MKKRVNWDSPTCTAPLCPDLYTLFLKLCVWPKLMSIPTITTVNVKVKRLLVSIEPL